ncbi:unnamed protein product [Parajaminaea phylloscopi]
MFRASSPTPTPRQRILSFLGGVASSSKANGDASSQRPQSPLPAVSQLQLSDSPRQAETPLPYDSQDVETGAMPETASPRPEAISGQSTGQQSVIQRKPSRTLARRLSSSSANYSFSAATVFRRKSVSQGSQNSAQTRVPPFGGGISNQDLPPASSDLDAVSDPASSVERSSMMTAARTPGSPAVSQADGPIGSTAAGMEVSSPLHPYSPPGSPTKKTRALFAGYRARKDSTTSVNSVGGSLAASRPSSPVKGLSLGASRPSSPVKGFSSPSGAAKRAIDKSSIGLPTNFKRTGGGGTNSPSLATAISLPGLSSPTAESGRSYRSPPSEPSRTPLNEGDPTSQSLQDSLAQIHIALNDKPPSPTLSVSPQRPPVSRPWSAGGPSGTLDRAIPDETVTAAQDRHGWRPRDNRLDTVKEVPSGFIQRFEKAGQKPSALPSLTGENEIAGLGSGLVRADARSIFEGSTEQGQPESSTLMQLRHLDKEAAGPIASVRAENSIVASPEGGPRSPPRSMSPVRPLSDRTAGGLLSTPPASPGVDTFVSSRAASPIRRARRKPVPQLSNSDTNFGRDTLPGRNEAQGDTPSRTSPSAAIETVHSSQPAQTYRPTPDVKQPTASPPSAQKQQDWASTLAEISEALNSPIGVRSPHAGSEAQASRHGDSAPHAAACGIVEQGQKRTDFLLHGNADGYVREWEEERINVKDR